MNVFSTYPLPNGERGIVMDEGVYQRALDAARACTCRGRNRSPHGFEALRFGVCVMIAAGLVAFGGALFAQNWLVLLAGMMLCGSMMVSGFAVLYGRWRDGATD